jgi:FHS family L-fucose permease-like MFS transporter
VMGWVGDVKDMSAAFLVPLGCFAVVAAYGFSWPKLSGSRNLLGNLGSQKGAIE